MKKLIIILFKNLGVCVGLICVHLTPTSLNFIPDYGLSLVIVLYTRDSDALIREDERQPVVLWHEGEGGREKRIRD